MKRIVYYKLVKHWDPDEVEIEVAGLIGEGWQPFGPPTVTSNDGTLAIIQAMVEYADD